MKKILVLFTLIVSPILSFGQSMFDTLEDMDGVDAVIINKEAFKILVQFGKEIKDNDALQLFESIKDLNELKMFSTNKSDIITRMNDMVIKQIKSAKLIELMRMKEGKTWVKIYVNSSKDSKLVSEVLMFSKGLGEKTDGFSDAAIVSLTGKIDINQLSKIANSMFSEKDVNIKVN